MHDEFSSWFVVHSLLPFSFLPTSWLLMSKKEEARKLCYFEIRGEECNDYARAKEKNTTLDRPNEVWLVFSEMSSVAVKAINEQTP